MPTFFEIKYHIKCFQLDFEHVNIKRSFFGNISTQLRQSKAAKTGERRQTGDHITAPSQTTPPAPPFRGIRPHALGREALRDFSPRDCEAVYIVPYDLMLIFELIFFLPSLKSRLSKL